MCIYIYIETYHWALCAAAERESDLQGTSKVHIADRVQAKQHVADQNDVEDYASPQLATPHIDVPHRPHWGVLFKKKQID